MAKFFDKLFLQQLLNEIKNEPDNIKKRVLILYMNVLNIWLLVQMVTLKILCRGV